MTRGINATTTAAMSGDSFRIATLVNLDLAAPVFLTDYGVNLTINSQLWTSSGHLLEVGDVSETAGLRVNSMTLALSGVEQSFVSAFLSSDYIDRQVKIYRAILDQSNVLVGSEFLVFDGRISAISIDDDENGSIITVEIASHWADFEKTNGRRTNTISQSIHFPGDLGFDYASQTIKNLKWGRG